MSSSEDAANISDGTKILGYDVEVVVDKTNMDMVNKENLMSRKLSSGHRYGHSRQSCDF